MWAPTKDSATIANGGTTYGSIISLNSAWGGSSAPTAYESNNGQIRVMAWLDTYSTADFDSGWLAFKSQQGSSSYKEVSHTLGMVPGRVKVLVQATDGANSGYYFHGLGSAQQDDITRMDYGGVVFAYNSTSVRHQFIFLFPFLFLFS